MFAVPTPVANVLDNPRRGFQLRVAGLVLVGLVVRIVYVLAFAPDAPLGGDALYYHWLANLLSEGHGFIRPVDFVYSGTVTPTAEHPPLYTLALAVMSSFGGKTYAAHRLASALIGSGTVAAVAYLGRGVAGVRVGLIAGAVAAIYPFLFAADGQLYSEGLYTLLIVLSMIAAYRLYARPTRWRALVLGGAIGLAALTRSEATLLVLILALPVCLKLRSLRWNRFGWACLATVVVLAPWTIRSSIALGEPVLGGTTSGGLFAGANCHLTYYGSAIGDWRFQCLKLNPGPRGNEAQKEDFWRNQGIDYAKDHLGRLPVVVGARILRAWDLYSPSQAQFVAEVEGRPTWTSQLGLVMYYPILALAVCGVIVLRQRKRMLWILLAPPVLVTITCAIGFGLTRYRMPAEPSLLVLAAVAVDAFIRQRAAAAVRPSVASRRQGAASRARVSALHRGPA
jgi:hypothetical protein